MPEFIVDHWNETEDGVLSRETMKQKLKKQVRFGSIVTFSSS